MAVHHRLWKRYGKLVEGSPSAMVTAPVSAIGNIKKYACSSGKCTSRGWHGRGHDMHGKAQELERRAKTEKGLFDSRARRARELWKGSRKNSKTYYPVCRGEQKQVALQRPCSSYPARLFSHYAQVRGE